MSICMRIEYKRREEPLEGGPDKHLMLCRVPVFRPVAVKLLRLLGNQDASVLEVSQLLKSDPGFSTEMLTMANSAAHGRSHRIHTIERAVVLLGLERTRSLATKTALEGMIRSLGGSLTVQSCWRHSPRHGTHSKVAGAFLPAPSGPGLYDWSHARHRTARIACS